MMEAPYLSALPLDLLRVLSTRNPVAPFYHLVSDDRVPYVEHLYSFKTSAVFEQDLIYLKRHYALVTHEAVAAHRESGQALPPRSAVISFDDGLKECFTIVRPMLLKHGVPCTFFIAPNFIGNKQLMHVHKKSLCIEAMKRLSYEEAAAALAPLEPDVKTPDALRHWVRTRSYQQADKIDRCCEYLRVNVEDALDRYRPYMTENEVLQLSRDGFTIGGHTLNHPELWLMPEWKEVEREIVKSCEWVRERTGQSKVPFAIPFNGKLLSRSRLGRLRRECDAIDLIYDTNNLAKDASFVVNRIHCDSLEGIYRDGTNLDHLIRRAHALEPLRALKRVYAPIAR
jgi:peptidoglycan/xylan/chitin deacetylase (PgdA/CDA1 family)